MLKRFRTIHPEKTYSHLSLLEIANYKDKLPDSLLEIWKTTGLSSYSGGLITLVYPSGYEKVLSAWFKKPIGKYIIGITAFGDLIIWDTERVYYLDVLYSVYTEFTKNLEIFFDSTLCKDIFLDDVLDRQLFIKATRELGELRPGEVFGFSIPVAKGGSSNLKNIIKVKSENYLQLLAGIGKPI